MLTEDLLQHWRELAELQDSLGASHQAQTLRWCASELAGALRVTATEILTLVEAANETGYSKDYLRQSVASGKIPNAGQLGRPRIFRRDLPTPKPTRRLEGPQKLVDRVLSADARVKDAR